MAYVTPNSSIWLYQGMRFDSGYKDTVYFPDFNTQKTFFTDYPHIVFEPHSYQRVNANQVKLSVKPDLIYNYNYMVFSNNIYDANCPINVTYKDAQSGEIVTAVNNRPNYSGKLWCAFIKKIDYVNENTALITYEIDVIQSYLFDFHLEPCMVEREHVDSDAIGQHVQAEPLDFGELICQRRQEIGGSLDDDRDWFHNNRIVVFYIGDSNGHLIGGIYSGLQVTSFYAGSTAADNIAALNQFLSTFINGNQKDKIVSIVLCPQGFVPATSVLRQEISNYILKQFTISRPTTIDGHTVRNNKLFTSPFMNFEVEVQTDKQTYQYELFENPNNISFNCKCSISPDPEILIEPYDYNSNSLHNLKDSLIMNGFPQCSFAIDAYKSWLANKASSQYTALIGQGISTVAGAASVGATVASGGSAAAIAGGATWALSSMIGMRQTQIQMSIDKARGSSLGGQTGCSTAAGALERCINVRHMCIRAEYAEVIDSFFDKYGYACNQIKVPNTHVRQSWTYTKTRECNLYGNIPEDDAEKIKSIFNNGITFWMNHNNIGDYSLPNATLNIKR
jgi:hypothetical protein